MMFDQWIETPKGAIISDDGVYRYVLWRHWETGPILNFIGLNPSTADASLDDQTIRKLISYAKFWKFAGLIVTNLFAFRATTPKELYRVPRDKIEGLTNTEIILHAARESDSVLVGWGRHGMLYDHDRYIMQMLKDEIGKPPRCIAVNKDYTPKHPLYHRLVRRTQSYLGRKWYERKFDDQMRRDQS